MADIIEEIAKADLTYALLQSFIKVLEQRAKEYEESYPNTYDVIKKLVRDTQLFLAGVKFTVDPLQGE